MYVQKRDGSFQPVHFDKITDRIRTLQETIEPVLRNVDAVVVAQRVIAGLVKGISTQELDRLASETAAYMSTQHPEYADLAARIAISNHHKQTESSFLKLTERLASISPKPLVNDVVVTFVRHHADAIQAALRYERDYRLDYFGFKTLECSYLLKDPFTKQV